MHPTYKWEIKEAAADVRHDAVACIPRTSGKSKIWFDGEKYKMSRLHPTYKWEIKVLITFSQKLFQALHPTYKWEIKEMKQLNKYDRQKLASHVQVGNQSCKPSAASPLPSCIPRTSGKSKRRFGII